MMNAEHSGTEDAIESQGSGVEDTESSSDESGGDSEDGEPPQLHADHSVDEGEASKPRLTGAAAVYFNGMIWAIGGFSYGKAQKNVEAFNAISWCGFVGSCRMKCLQPRALREGMTQ